MADSSEVPIPQPPGVPFFGNAGDFDAAYPLGTLIHMAETYGLRITLCFSRKWADRIHRPHLQIRPCRPTTCRREQPGAGQ